MQYDKFSDTASSENKSPVPNSGTQAAFPIAGIANAKRASQLPKSIHSGISRDEMNLAEFPLAVLSTRVDTRIKTLEFTDYTKGPKGEMVERKWVITGADKFGLPTSTDDDVVLGLIRLTMEQGFREPKVYFTRYELLKALGWSTEGRSYQRLVKSLDRLSGVRVRSSNSFYDNSSKTYQTSNFGVIDAYEINDERVLKQTGNAEKSSFFIWSEMLFDSFKSGYIKKLDLNLYFSLKTAIARRLYRYLDKHFYFKDVIDTHLLTLAFEKVGLSRSYKYISSVKQQLAPALAELEEVGFLSAHEYLGNKEATVLRFYSSKSRAHAKRPSLEEETPVSEPKATARDMLINRIKSALVARGLSEVQSLRLLSSHSKEVLNQLETIIEYYDFLVSRSDQRVSKNPVGFLYRAVENPYKFTVPEDFLHSKLQSKSLKSPKSKRPEHKVVKASQQRSPRRNQSKTPETSRKPEADSVSDKAEYKAYIENEVNQIMTRIAPMELGQLFAETESKMKSLQRILGKDRFREAVEGCVRDELKRKFGLPTFESWISKR